MKTKFAIGCLVQWYESDIIEYYIESLKDAIDSYDGEVLVDIAIVRNDTLEKPASRKEFAQQLIKIKSICNFATTRIIDDLYTIADYRREFNDSYCEKVDVLIWGESDAILPKQMFIVLDQLHQQSIKINNPKYF